MEVHEGDKVEVCSKQQGFVASYFEATVIKQLHYDSYKVRYKNLVEEDGTTPSVEVVSRDEIPPVPLEEPRAMVASDLRVFDVVDAFVNDGCWVGKITGMQGPSHFFVYFDDYNADVAYHVFQLRLHQEWVNGKWVVFSRRRH